MTGKFAATGSFVPRSGPGVAGAALLPNGKVLIVPFYAPFFLEIYDPAAGTFTTQERPQPPNPGVDTAKGSAVLLTNGRVLLAGGVDDPGASAYAEVYDPIARSFSVPGEMTMPRDGHKSVLLPDGTVLVTGGENPQNFPASLASAEVFDPAAGMFSSTANMTTRRIRHTATLLINGSVLIAGGSGTVVAPTSTSSAESIDHR